MIPTLLTILTYTVRTGGTVLDENGTVTNEIWSGTGEVAFIYGLKLTQD